MGFTYLDGKRWEEVTRDERFFCQRLYQRINDETPESFVRFLVNERGLEVPLAGEWEAGLEVCFYRDLWHLRGKAGPLFSPKRTFDICFFSEKSIVIVEAKAAVDFDVDQNHTFARDIAEVKRQTGASHVELMGLCSSKCHVEPELASVFTGPILTWRELAERYSDEILFRADAVYEKGQAFSSSRSNSNARLDGMALLQASQGGAKWWVGRGGGLGGERFRTDIETGGWRRQMYEVNTATESAPSSNYFSLSDFALAVSKTTG